MKLEHKNFGSSNAKVSRKEQEEVNDIKSLIELGSITDEIRISGKTFEMSTLNASKRLSLARFLTDDPSPENLFEFNIRTLSSAINTVNGKPLEQFHPQFDNGANLDEIENMRYEIISSMQSSVIGKLLNFYNDLAERSDKQFDTEKIKK